MNRILYFDGTTLTDHSAGLANYYSDSLAVTMDTDHALYVGCLGPFNHIYTKLAVGNTLALNVNVAYYDGKEFKDAVDIIDETTMLGASGHITFTTDKNEGGWTSEDTEDITELNTVNIYDRYWIKITVDSITDPIELKWIGQLFSNDLDLGSEYPDLVRSEVKNAFESGKVDWEEQGVRTGEIIIKDLIAKNVIDDKCQVLDREKFKLASVSQVAGLIFNALGDDYVDQRTDALNQYTRRLDLRLFNIDVNNNGRIDKSDRKFAQGWLKR